MRLLSALTILAIALTGCRSHTADFKSTTGLQNMGQRRVRQRGFTVPAIRRMAIQDQAMSLGAQAGLAKRAKQIDDMLTKYARQLDRTFNFDALLLAHNVLPPVLSEGQHGLRLSGDYALRIADRTYKIEKQARFVTVAPNWRDYLMLDYEAPPKPHNTLMPKNRWEKRIWDKIIKEGWVTGSKQANDIFEDSLARLTHEFRGMILYRRLLAQHMVSPPYVAKTDLGVTGGGHRMDINDQVLRITALPSLQANAKTWKAAVTAKEQPKPADDIDRIMGMTNGHAYDKQPIHISNRANS